MKTRDLLAALILWSALLPSPAPAQYWGERVLDKGFEHTDFFFTPTYLMPYGIGSFKETTPGLVPDPLQEIIVNPARLTLDSARTAWVYTDFRGAKHVKEENDWVVPVPTYGILNQALYYPYPRLFLESRRELEPVFSGAAIVQPFPDAVPGFTVAATYQYILQDSKYYAVPQNIYKTAAGYDFNGRTIAASDAMPIIDKYSGKDDMHQAGHFLSSFVRYEPAADLAFGCKVSRASFQRSGSYGSSNFWDNSSASSSLWADIERRSQGYASWDVCGGITYRFTPSFTVGLTAGRLWGSSTQALRTNDSSYYAYAWSQSSSYYNRSANGLYLWDHSGTTWYYGVDLLVRTSANSTVSAYYRRRSSDIDIALGSRLLDTSFSTYAYENNGTPYSGVSHSFLSDNRSGTGLQTIRSDKVMGSVRWQMNDCISLVVGAQLEWYSMDIRTSESVELSNAYSSFYSVDGGSWQTRQNESKDLQWTFTSRRTSLQIPLFLTIRASQYMQFLIGINRDMSSWSIDDMTLALFRYRLTVQNGVENRQDNFGERYTLPNENDSDVRTTVLGGITLAPSDMLQLRLLVVPDFREGLDGQEFDQLQVWLGVTVTP